MKLLKKSIIYLVFLLLTIVSFWDVIFNLNHKFFSTGGDGLKAYYCSLFHIKYDSSYDEFSGMNYPWGESIYFTDSQPPLTNFIKFIDSNVFNCDNFTVGIINFMIIFSFFLSMVFIFLILKKFKIPDWYAIIVSIFITLLSPQIVRMAGHFSLGWIFWIPLMIYLTILIIEKKSFIVSSIFGAVTLLASLMHMYFFVFSAALMLICLIEYVIRNKNLNAFSKSLFHFLIQIIIPFIIIQLIMTDNQPDRTMHPFGFYGYRAYPGTVFLPFGKWYTPFITELHFTKKYSWEGISYIGLISSVGFWFMLVKWMVNLFKQNRNFSFTNNRKLDVLFWASFLLLLFSFGLPFILGLESIRNSFGFLSQLRGVGRFAWLFYYVINIIVWIKIFNEIFIRKNRVKAIIITGLLFFIMGFEALDYSVKNINNINNEISQLADENNVSELNQWISKIDSHKYQAMIPFPFFHIGSESIWMDPYCGIDKQIFIASLKTGLPFIGSMMGRTSISQSYMSVEISLAPWDNYRIVDEFIGEKPLLLLVAKCDKLNQNEKYIIGKSSFITESPDLFFYELQLDSLRKIPKELQFQQKYQSLIDSIENESNSGEKNCFIVRTGNLFSDGKYLEGVKLPKRFELLYQSEMEMLKGSEYYIRFWVKDYDDDMIARTDLSIDFSNSGYVLLNKYKTQIWRHLKSINKEWALIEIPFIATQENEIIKVFIKNSTLNGHDIYFDEFTISSFKL